jgi:ABC-type multidrug transport system ATPase subunit
MTVREHLQFYGRLKGNMSSKELARDINEYVLSKRIL